jgi:hypothetical protein
LTLEIKTQKRDKTTRGEQEKRAKISKLLMQNQQNLSPKRAREQENLKCKGRGEERREEVFEDVGRSIYRSGGGK